MVEASNPVGCGHLRVYHARGLPDGDYEERAGTCLFCDIERLQRESAEMKHDIDRMTDTTTELATDNDRLRAALEHLSLYVAANGDDWVRATALEYLAGAEPPRPAVNMSEWDRTMKISYGNGPTEYGPGVSIELTGDEVATAIDAWLVARGVHVDGPRTITVNGELCRTGRVYVDPEGFVISPRGRKLSGRGPENGSDGH